MSKTQARTITVIGAPFSKGQPKAGTELGPKALRDAGVVAKLQELGQRVEDQGDVQYDRSLEGQDEMTDVKNHKCVSDVNKKLSDKIHDCVSANKTVIVLGGDHSIGTGSVHGHAQAEPNLVVLWIDAHADINTPGSSVTKNMHGMPLSFVVNELSDQIDPRIMRWCKPCLSSSKLSYIALRDVDPAERSFIEQLGIKSFSMQEVDELGIKETLRRALGHIDPQGTAPIHVSFDIDSLDPQYMPSTGTAVPGGLTLREMFYIADHISNTGRLSVLDVAEVNPLIGSPEDVKMTVRNTADIIAAFYGRRREGNNKV